MGKQLFEGRLVERTFARVAGVAQLSKEIAERRRVHDERIGCQEVPEAVLDIDPDAFDEVLRLRNVVLVFPPAIPPFAYLLDIRAEGRREFGR